jgi:hypothetical protein
MGIEKLLLEQTAGSGGQDGFFFAGHGGEWSVVIGDFDFEGVSPVPTEAEPPLVVDAEPYWPAWRPQR